MTEGPVLSVCIATYNRADRLDRLLHALAAQELREPFQVVVYDDASTDGTAQVLSSWISTGELSLDVHRGAVNRGPAVGRNTAWRASRAPLVLFTDDDCVPLPGWAVAHLTSSGSRRVTVGRTCPHPEQRQLEGPFSRSLDVTGTTFFQTCNIGYPRALLDELGGFDEGFRRAAGEDTELGLRAVKAGAQAVFAPEAEVYHDVRPSSWLAAVRESAKWVDIPLFAKRHPDSGGSVLHSTRWWKRSHPPAVLAVAGLAAMPWQPVLVVAVLPWLHLRTGRWRVNSRIRQWPWVLPGQLIVDLAEVTTLVRGSLRHRRFLL